MTTDLHPDLDPSIRRRFGTVADDARVRRAAAALEANGISVLLVDKILGFKSSEGSNQL